MIFLNILLIAARIFCGLCVIGFVLSLFLWKKHKIFEKIICFTGFFAMFYGVGSMFMFALFGNVIKYTL